MSAHPILILLAAALLQPITVVAQSAVAPEMGTWKMNHAKTRMDPGPPPREQTLIFEPFGPDGVKRTSIGVPASGPRTETVYTAQYDGKDHPISGGAATRTVSLRRMDAYTAITVDKEHGQVTRMQRRSVSRDGSTLTFESVGIDAQGRAFHNVTVYDKQ